MHTEQAPSNPEIRYEKTDAHPRPLYQFLFWLCAICIVTALMCWGIVVGLTKWRESTSQRAAMAPEEANREVPSPRLQLREMVDLATFKAQEHEILSTYGVVDKEQGLYRIPIEEAMRLTLEHGLPVRTLDPAKAGEKAKPAASEPKASKR